MRCASACDDLRPRKTFVPDRERERRGFRYDRKVSSPLPHERLGAQAHVFFIGHACDDEPTAGPSGRQIGRRSNHRGDTALHVLRSAPVQTSIRDAGLERIGHAFNPDRVEVPAQHDARTRLATREYADDIRATGRDFLQNNVQSCSRHRSTRDLGNLALPWSARHQRWIDRVGGNQVAEQRNFVKHGINCIFSPMVVVITGASAGIGRATAERLARNGASVVITARRAELLEEVAAGINRPGVSGRAVAMAADVTDPAAMESVAAATVSQFGRIDVMVCNAGIGFPGRLTYIPPDAD